MTGVGSFVADAMHNPEAIPLLKCFRHGELMKGQFRLRTAVPNCDDVGEYPNSSVTLSGTVVSEIGVEVDLHGLCYCFSKQDGDRIDYLLKLGTLVAEKAVTVGKALDARGLSNRERSLLIGVKHGSPMRIALGEHGAGKRIPRKAPVTFGVVGATRLFHACWQ